MLGVAVSDRKSGQQNYSLDKQFPHMMLDYNSEHNRNSFNQIAINSYQQQYSSENLNIVMNRLQDLICSLIKQQQQLNILQQNASSDQKAWGQFQSIKQAYRNMIRKIEQRKKKTAQIVKNQNQNSIAFRISKNLSQNMPIISDIFMMESVSLLVTFMQSKIYLSDKRIAQQQDANRQSAKQFLIIDQTQIIDMPIAKISKNIIEAIKTYESNVKSADNLKVFYNWYEKQLDCINSEQYDKLKLFQLRNTIILSQYPRFDRSQKIILASKIARRMKLINIIKKSAKKAQKNISQRRSRILQLVQGERKYIEKLDKYITSVKMPIQEMKLLKQDQCRKIFANIEAIKGFHSQLYRQLNQKFSSYQKIQQYAPIFKRNIPFFKLYLEYILEINEGAQKFFIKKQQSNPQIKKICQKFYNQSRFKASDVMMEPVFKISKYSIFFKDIIKYTNAAHPDKQQMKEVLQKFSSILSSVNNNIGKIMGQNRIYQLQSEFNTIQIPIIAQNRSLIDQFQTQIFIGKQKILALIIVFNDTTLIISQSAKKVIRKLQYDDRFHVQITQQNQLQIIQSVQIKVLCSSQRQAINIYTILKQRQDKNVKNFLFSRFKRQIIKFKKYRQQILSKLGHCGFPISQLIKVLQKFESSFDRRREIKWQFFSDIFYLHSIDIHLSLVKMLSYIKQLKNSQLMLNSQLISSLKLLLQGDGQNIKSQMDALMVPINFIKVKMLQILQNYTIKVKRTSKIQDQQMKSIQNFISWYVHTCGQVSNKLQEYVKLQNARTVLIKTQYRDCEQTQRINIIIIKKLILFGKLRKKANKAQQRLNKKKLTLLQLVEGQQNYIQKLSDYINQIKNPIQQIPEIKLQTCRKLFSTIVQIKQFHSQFYKQVSEKYQKFQKYQCYGANFKKFLPFFKLYVQYIYNANHQNSQEILKQLQQVNPKVRAICKDFLNSKKFTAVDALLQPTNRVAKYSFIFQNLIKYTNPDHPDFLALKQTLKLFQDISSANNRHVNKIVNRNKLIQLNIKYSTKQNPIVSKNRELLEQYNVFLITDNNRQKVILYILNDMLLIIDSISQKLIHKIDLDYRFFVRRGQDNKSNQNLIKIHSDSFIYISPGNQEKFEFKRQEIFKLLQSISPQKQELISVVQVKILGTQSVASTSIAKHTKYIIEFIYKGFKRKTYLRFSDVEKVISQILLRFQDALNLLEQTNFDKSFLNNYKEETIEKRKNNIQQFLQKLINHEKVRAKPDFFLKLVGLNQKFFQNAESSYKKSMQLLKDAQAANSKLKQSERQDALTILCATQIELGKNIFFDIQQNKGINKILQQKNNLKIKIKIFNKDQSVTISINQEAKVQQVLDKVSKLIGLRNNKDFRIFHEVGKKQSRVLDPQQKIFQLFKSKLIDLNNESQKPGIFASVLKKVFSHQQSSPYLSLKKHIFLPGHIEQKQFNRDLVRLKLLVFQAFSEIRDIKYHLSFDQYILFLAMFIYINLSGDLNQENVKGIDLYIIHKVIPEQIFKTKNYSQKQLLEKSLEHLRELDLSIDKIIRKNKTSVTQSSIKIQSSTKMSLFFNKQFICCRIFLAKISKNPSYGASLFYVQLQKQTFQIIKNKVGKSFYNVWLSLKLNQVALLAPTTKQKIIDLDFSNIVKIVVYSEAIVIKMDQVRSQVRKYKINTFQSYVISELFNYNKAMDRVLKKLKDDSELIYKTNLYKQQLLEYRT